VNIYLHGGEGLKSAFLTRIIRKNYKACILSTIYYSIYKFKMRTPFTIGIVYGSATPHSTHLSSTDLSTVLSDPLLL
jgi:hypothetical protein